MDGLAAFQQNATGFFRELPPYLPAARYWQEDGLFIGISGWNLSAFNNAFVLDEQYITARHLQRIRAIFAVGSVPFSVVVFSRQAVPTCDVLFKEHGYVDVFTDQIMIHEGQQFPRAANPAVEVHPVANALEQADFMNVVVSAFELPPSMPIEMFSDLMRIPIFHPMIAYLDDYPVGTGMLLYCQGVAAVYNVGTLTALRGKGIGTAMMTALHQRALADGYRATVLASTPSGYSLYQHLGYRLDGYQITYSPIEYLNGP